MNLPSRWPCSAHKCTISHSLDSAAKLLGDSPRLVFAGQLKIVSNVYGMPHERTPRIVIASPLGEKLAQYECDCRFIEGILHIPHQRETVAIIPFRIIYIVQSIRDHAKIRKIYPFALAVLHFPVNGQALLEVGRRLIQPAPLERDLPQHADGGAFVAAIARGAGEALARSVLLFRQTQSPRDLIGEAQIQPQPEQRMGTALPFLPCFFISFGRWRLSQVSPGSRA